MIRFDAVTKRYPRSGEALSDVSFRLGKGEFAFVTGPSGAGKSTLLELVHMQTLPTEGTVRVSRFSSDDIQREEIPRLRRRVGFVFQDFRLLDRLTASENVAFALEATGTPRDEIDDRVQKLLSQVGLAAKARSHPKELSGGERQRVGIARALATDPLVLLADEPTGNLDERASHGVFRLFRRINDRGMAVLLATHDNDLLREHPEIRALELEEGSLVYDSGAGSATSAAPSAAGQPESTAGGPPGSTTAGQPEGSTGGRPGGGASSGDGAAGTGPDSAADAGEPGGDGGAA